MKTKRKLFLTLFLVSTSFFLVHHTAQTANMGFNMSFDDQPLEKPLEHPSWFKHSFLDLNDDLKEALAKNKKGIVIYFGQRRCAYCLQLMNINFKMPDIVAYTQRNFDIIPIDIWGIDEVTDFNQNVLTEREYAVRENTNFTPSLLFYSPEGKKVLLLRGYYPPYKFRAALEYVADAHYKKESFPAYIARGDSTMVFEADELNEEEFFIPPPHNLDRSKIPGQRPLVVFFEQGKCHACDILHTQPLKEKGIGARLADEFDSVQMDMWSDQPIITPDGNKTTMRDWASKLGLFYTPSIIFFDEKGKEIIRVDSVVRFYRLRGVLKYVSSKAYQTEPNYLHWRSKHR